MKVLKFGGTSVGSAKNIKKVIEIVKSSCENDQIAVVVSAVGGITDKLMSASQKAIDNDLNYKNDFNKLKQQHLDVTEGLLSGTSLVNTTDIILEKLTELERLLDGIFLIKELSPKTTDKLLSFGENIELGKMADQYPTGRVAPTVTWRLMKQIVEVNGDSSKEKIAEFVNILPIMDSKYIRQFIRDNAPSLDLTQTVKAPSGEMVNFDITFGVEFFRPFF